MLNTDEQVIGQNRDKQVGSGPPGNLMIDRPHPEVCLQRPERSLHVGEGHVAPPDLCGGQVLVAGFNDVTPVDGDPFFCHRFFDNRQALDLLPRVVGVGNDIIKAGNMQGVVPPAVLPARQLYQPGGCFPWPPTVAAGAGHRETLLFQRTDCPFLLLSPFASAEHAPALHQRGILLMYIAGASGLCRMCMRPLYGRDSSVFKGLPDGFEIACVVLLYRAPFDHDVRVFPGL